MGMTAQVIREKRQARGETLEAVARACGLNTGTMWRIESGRTNPRAETLAALARHFGCSIETLMGDPPNEYPPGYMQGRGAS